MLIAAKVQTLGESGLLKALAQQLFGLLQLLFAVGLGHGNFSEFREIWTRSSRVNFASFLFASPPALNFTQSRSSRLRIRASTLALVKL